MKNTATIHHLPASEKQLTIEGVMELPEPPIPDDCDLRNFRYMPLDVQRFIDSKFATTVDPASGFFAIQLWAKAWHQLPAGSLPNDDDQLRALSGCGRDTRLWQSVKDGAMYGWVLHSDNRLYHSALTEFALDAYDKLLINREKGKKGGRPRKDSGNTTDNQQDSTGKAAVNPRLFHGKAVVNQEKGIEENREEDNPLYPPSENPEETKPKATGKQSPKNDSRTRLTSAWLEENTDAMKQVYFGKMRESELKATEQRWSYIRGGFVEYWINSATNAEKFKKAKWLDTWENEVEKQINYNKLKWKAEEEHRPINGASNAPQGKHALSENFLTTGRGVDWDYIQSQWAEQGGA